MSYSPSVGSKSLTSIMSIVSYLEHSMAISGVTTEAQLLFRRANAPGGGFTEADWGMSCAPRISKRIEFLVLSMMMLT